jgi:protein-ribulosamine 3-kinase
MTERLIIFFEKVLHDHTGSPQKIINYSYIGGGNINNAVKLATSSKSYFLKWNQDLGDTDLFEKETDGLDTLSKGPIKVPSVYAYSKINETPYLLLEYLEKGSPKKTFWEGFGEKLAHLHQITKQSYGYHLNNHIGRLPQQNDWKSNWIDFFVECRLEVQLSMAVDSHLIDSSTASNLRSIYSKFEKLIPTEPASLLHGDLWSGNFMVGPDGNAAIFDPAVYYGNREIEIAFTHLFGGFDSRFYESYMQTYPLEADFDERIDIYNLYPLLVHVNLFGSSYLSGITRTIRRFL